MSKETTSNNKTITDPLIEPYFIQMDQYCYTVFEKITPGAGTSGKEYTQAVGHYKNFTSCLKTIIETKTKDKNYDSLKDFIKEYEENTNKIINLIER